MDIKLSILQALKIHRSTKQFILFNYDSSNKLTNYTLTDDLQYRDMYDSFRVMSCIRSNISTITI
jgi:hypothetical protein